MNGIIAKKYIIIGGGAAGVFAAKKIRDYDQSAEIEMFHDEPTLLFSKPRLPEYLAGQCTLEDLLVFEPEWYEKYGISVLLKDKATCIDPVRKEVITERGEKRKYDKLLLATGSQPVRPNIPGATDPHVFTVRTIADIEKIRSLVPEKKRAVVIGGGLLGLEIANALIARGCAVTVVEYCERLMPRQLDADASAVLKAILEERGMRFILGSEVVGIETISAEQFVAVRGKEKLCSELVVFSMGIRPAVNLAKGAGITTVKGIVVNNHMETSKPDIYAAGDCAEHQGRIYGLWSAAMEQGEYAAANMAGVPREYQGTVLSTVLKVAGVDVASVGDISGSDGVRQEAVADPVAKHYKKIFLKGTKLVGAILVGNNKIVLQIKKFIQEGTAINDARQWLSALK